MMMEAEVEVGYLPAEEYLELPGGVRSKEASSLTGFRESVLVCLGSITKYHSLGS